MSLRAFMDQNPNARPSGCSICKHPERDAVEAAIREWLEFSPSERRNFGVRKLSLYISTEVLDGAEGRWPGRQTIEKHRDECMGERP